MRAAFDAAVERHGPTVLRVCRAVLGPGADADDAWSETFLSALRAWPDLPEETDVEAWLVRVAHRRAVDVVRRSARAATPGGTADDLAELDARDARRASLANRSSRGSRGSGGHGGPGARPAHAGPDDYDDDTVSRVDDHWIWSAVADLPAKQRVCVAYRYLGGLRYAEIAELVGGSEAAARRAAADGVAALRTMMETERTS